MSKRMPKRETTMLWKGTGPASHVTLLGSLHALFEPPPEWALEPAQTLDQIVLEGDVTSFSREAMERPHGETITGTWPNLYSSFERATTVADVDFDQLDRAWPAWAAIVLAMRIVRDQLPHGVEAVVSSIRDSRGITPRFLESSADFPRLIASIPLAEQVRYLQWTILSLESGHARLARAEAAWRRGQLSALAASLDLLALSDRHPEIFASLFELRHQLWAPRLEAYIRESADAGQTLLVVVGAGHLWGPSSLMAYMQPKGFMFEPITLT